MNKHIVFIPEQYPTKKTGWNRDNLVPLEDVMKFLNKNPNPQIERMMVLGRYLRTEGSGMVALANYYQCMRFTDGQWKISELYLAWGFQMEELVKCNAHWAMHDSTWIRVKLARDSFIHSLKKQAWYQYCQRKEYRVRQKIHLTRKFLRDLIS